MGTLKDLTGMRFGRLIVVERNGSTAYGKALWKCKCDCGKYVDVVGNHLQNGNTKSCGCYMRETARACNSTHGKSQSRLYHIWKNMRQRCHNPNTPCYKYYGGREISICPEWSDYSCFERWAVKNGYSDDLTIDRIDPNGNYHPDNCRWVTMRVQTRNYRKNIVVEYQGETHCLIDWADILGINYKTLYNRVHDYGWTIERAFKTPCRRSNGGHYATVI